MGRLAVAIAAIALVGSSSLPASAEPLPRITMDRGDGQVTVSVQKAPLTVTQTLTPRSFDLTIADRADRVRLTGDADGRVTIERNGHRYRFAVRGAGVDIRKVQALFSGSTALEQFDRLMSSPWIRSEQSAAVFVLAHAMVGVMQGHYQPLVEIVAATRSREPMLVTVSQPTRAGDGPGGCWDKYSRDVVRYTYELEGCLRDASESLNPLRSASCAYEYNFKSTLAFFWLLDCSGFWI